MADHSKNRGRGDVGEEAVAQFLIDHRCTITARNYISYGGGEIDIIAENEARMRGAMGELKTEVRVDERSIRARDGAEVSLGTVVTARATGRIGF